MSDRARQDTRLVAPPPRQPVSTPKEEVSPATSGDSQSPRPRRGQVGTVSLILRHRPDSDDLYLSQAFWREAGKARLRFRFVKPEPSEQRFSERLREVIAAAVAGDALIVQIDDDSAPVESLYDARARGVTILLIDRPLEPRGNKTLPCITYESFAPAGRQIATTLLERARRSQAASSDRIVLLENRTPHRYRAERIASLADALHAAGRSYETVSFEQDGDSAKEAIEKALSTGPAVAIVLAEEDIGLFNAQAVLVKRLEQHLPEFVLGGYYAYDFRSAGNNRKITVFGDPSVEAFAVKAFQTVQRLMEGKVVPEKTEIPISIHVASAAEVPSDSNRHDKSRASK